MALLNILLSCPALSGPESMIRVLNRENEPLEVHSCSPKTWMLRQNLLRVQGQLELQRENVSTKSN